MEGREGQWLGGSAGVLCAGTDIAESHSTPSVRQEQP